MKTIKKASGGRIVQTPAVCTCGHARDDHGDDHRDCLDDDCDCIAFEEDRQAIEEAQDSMLTSHKSRSCGHSIVKRGMRETPTYRIWITSKRKHKFCDRWLSFVNFISDIGERLSPKHRLVRIDPNGIYEPANCKWGTVGELARSSKRCRKFIVDGKIITAAELARRLGMSRQAIHCRIKDGWAIEKIISEPKIEYGIKHGTKTE